MRRYRLEIRGRLFEIDIDEPATDRYTVVVGDETYDVLLSSDEDLPVARITPQLDAAAHGRDASGAGTPVAEPVRAASTTPAAALRAAAAGGKAAVPGSNMLSAPMPGVIVEVGVVVGAKVHRGDVVVVLDAMKMNNMIRAPRDGTVAEVLVAVGQAVGHGDPLVRFEAT